MFYILPIIFFIEPCPHPNYFIACAPCTRGKKEQEGKFGEKKEVRVCGYGGCEIEPSFNWK